MRERKIEGNHACGTLVAGGLFKNLLFHCNESDNLITDIVLMRVNELVYFSGVDLEAKDTGTDQKD